MDERLILLFMLFFLVIIYVDGSACGNAVLEEGEFCDFGAFQVIECPVKRIFLRAL